MLVLELLKLEALAIKAIITEDLDVSMLPKVTKEQVEAFRKLVKEGEEYWVEKVEVEVERRDEGLVTEEQKELVRRYWYEGGYVRMKKGNRLKWVKVDDQFAWELVTEDETCWSRADMASSGSFIVGDPLPQWMGMRSVRMLVGPAHMAGKVLRQVGKVGWRRPGPGGGKVVSDMSREMIVDESGGLVGREVHPLYFR